MADLMEELLEHQFIYVPRIEGKDTLPLGKRLGLAVARAHRARLTVLAPRKDAATNHAELAKLDIVTDRSGYVEDGGVVLVWCPRYKTMEQAKHLEKSVIVLVEWIPGEFESWAKLVGAYNAVSGKAMDAELSEATRHALDGIVDEGYNGWTKSTDELMTRSYLEDLAKAGAYNRDLVLAYARLTKSEDSIGRLTRILEAFEGRTPIASRRL